MSTWSETIADAVTALENGGVDEAPATAEYLAAYVLGVWNRSEVQAFLEKSPTDAQSAAFRDALARRIAHEPLQYIVGETEFYGLRLFCSPAALIPRPETEVVVEEALKEIATFAGECSIIDIGTGTGAIVLAIASRCRNAQCVGIDISEAAIELAEKNRQRLGFANASFVRADFPSELDRLHGPFDLIVSNPPYIPAGEVTLLSDEVKNFEPVAALTDRDDGFSFYEAIAASAARLLTERGVIVVETEYKGAPRVREIFRSQGLVVRRTVKDLLGYERVVVASRS